MGRRPLYPCEGMHPLDPDLRCYGIYLNNIRRKGIEDDGWLDCMLVRQRSILASSEREQAPVVLRLSDRLSDKIARDFLRLCRGRVSQNQVVSGS